MIRDITWKPTEKNTLLGYVSSIHFFTIYPMDPEISGKKYLISTEILPDSDLKKSKFDTLQEAQDHCTNILLWVWCKITDNRYIINIIRKADK